MIVIIMGNILKINKKNINDSLKQNLLEDNKTTEFENNLYNLKVSYDELLNRVKTLEDNSVTNIKTLSKDLHYLNDKYKDFDNKIETLDNKIETLDNKIESVIEVNKMLIKRLDT